MRNRTFLKKRALALRIGLLLLPMSAGVTAQTVTAEGDAGDTQQKPKELDTVVVTATRRSEPLKDVPISITALSQEELDKKGIVGYEGMAQATPGVVLNRASANFNNFTARGIATNGYNANLQSTVAIYIDELPISSNGNSTILDPSLFDVERIEFLRGPQGTLFGSGSLAGALRILTHAPDPSTFEASFLADLGMTGSNSLRQRYNAMVNIPLVKDTLALRVVGFARNEEGYVDNIGTGIENANTLKSSGGRATLLWQPTDEFSAKLRVSHEESKPEDSSLINPALDPDRDKRRSDRPDLFTGTMTNYNLTADYQFSGAHLTSSSTWSDFSGRFYVDLAATFAHAIPFALDCDYWDDVFTQEVRLVSDAGGKLDWVLGGFYFEREREINYNYRSTPEFLAANGITGLPDEYYQRFGYAAPLKEHAIFGELTYHFNDDLWVTGGVRYGSIEAQGITHGGGYNSNYLTNALLGVSGPLTLVPISEVVGDKGKETGPSYRLSASWRPTPSLTTYASIATGFRAPVVNARAGAASVIDPNDLIIPYGAKSDKLTNYEMGLKGRWLDGRLTGDVALYYIDWNDIQVQANRVSDSVQFATNIGGASSRGVEFQLVAMPNMNWTIALNGSFNKAKVDTLTGNEAAISGAVMGARLSGPEFSGSLSANYAFDLPRNAQGDASLSVMYVGRYPGSFPNVPGNPGVVSPTYGWTESYTIVNASVGADFGNYNVSLYAENLFDDDSINYVHPEAFLDSRYGVTRPRTVGVRLGYRF